MSAPEKFQQLFDIEVRMGRSQILSSGQDLLSADPTQANLKLHIFGKSKEPPNLDHHSVDGVTMRFVQQQRHNMQHAYNNMSTIPVSWDRPTKYYPPPHFFTYRHRKKSFLGLLEPYFLCKFYRPSTLLD